MKNKILVSQCFTGENVTWNGSNNLLHNSWLNLLKCEGRLIYICPEMSGGLAVPREPAERQASGKILTVTLKDVTRQFESGASEAVALALKNKCVAALLKENSPSCGSQEIYNGSFDGTLIPGEGETAKQLREVGISVFNEHQIDQLKIFYKKTMNSQ